MMISPKFKWPDFFPRWRSEAWTTDAVDDLAKGYDSVEHHGWYKNLEPTLDSLAHHIRDNDVVLDYSGGTGILTDKLLKKIHDKSFGVLLVDSSPKFLRLALEKFRQEEKVAFRLIPYLKEMNRVQRLQEALEPEFQKKKIDVLVSTNAVHLYHDLLPTFQSWSEILKPGGFLHIQSGNIAHDDLTEDEWIIDRTVDEVFQAALDIVNETPAYRDYRRVSQDPGAMRPYIAFLKKIFLPPRNYEIYSEGLKKSGFTDLHMQRVPITARVSEWKEFLCVYQEPILGWIGGNPKLGSPEPSSTALADRNIIFDLAFEKVFGSKTTFNSSWTYIEGYN